VWWMMWAWAATPPSGASSASWGSAASWEDTLTRGLHRDGVWLGAGPLAERLSAHCSAGIAAACTWQDNPEQVAHPDVHAVGLLLAPACDRGDAVACLAAGWSLGTDDAGRLSSHRARDADQALAYLDRACEGGSWRGCTARARAQSEGLGTYASDDKAEAQLHEPCSLGEPRACRELAHLNPSEQRHWMQQAADHGDPLARWLLADRGTARAAHAVDVAACDDGVVEACEALAQSGEAVASLSTACEHGHVPSCARSLVVDGADPADVAELRSLAPYWPTAGAWAELSAHGATIRPWWNEAELEPHDERSLPGTLQRALWPCYRDALADPALRGADMHGWANVLAQVEESGDISGVSVRGDWVSEPFARCAFTASLGAQPLTTGSGPRLVRVPVPFAHAASIDAETPAKNATADFTTVTHSIDTWALALDQCAIGLGEVLNTEPLVRVKVKPNGTVGRVKLIDGSGSAAVDQCIVDALSAQRSDPIVTPLPVDLAVRFLQPRDLPPEPAVTYRDEPWPHAGPAAVDRVLVLVLEGNEVDGEQAKLGARSIHSIEEAFDQAAAWVAEHSGGAMTLDVTVRPVAMSLRNELGTSERSFRWHVSADDLPPELVRSIEPATWDVVQLWAPLPRGAPQASLGVVWGDRTLRGAGFITSALASGRELVGGKRSLEYLVLQGLYHHWRRRADAHLGVQLPPNDRVLRLADDTTLDPRSWTDEPMAFYRHLFHNDLTPALWRDLASWGEELNRPREGNLAYGADAIASDGVELAEYVNDGILTQGDHVAWARDHADEPGAAWFGVRFPEATPVASVQAVLAIDPSTALPEVRLQVQQDGAWRELSPPTVDADGVIDEVSFEPVDAEAVRLWVSHPEVRAVTELEVYGP